MRRRTAASKTWPRLRNRDALSVALSSREEIVAPPAASQPPPAGAAVSLGRPGAHRAYFCWLLRSQRLSLFGSARRTRTFIARINSALPCRSAIAERSVATLVDPLGVEPRPDGLRVRCNANFCYRPAWRRVVPPPGIEPGPLGFRPSAQTHCARVGRGAVHREETPGHGTLSSLGACQGTLIIIALRLSETSRGARWAHLGPGRNRGVRDYTFRAFDT